LPKLRGIANVGIVGTLYTFDMFLTADEEYSTV
ncbi:hypothetical protein T4A_6781, partial [Trichinella pseudospiralis]